MTTAVIGFLAIHAIGCGLLGILFMRLSSQIISDLEKMSKRFSELKDNPTSKEPQ